MVTELNIRGKNLKPSLAFITKSYSAVPKNVRLNSTYYFIPKIAFNYSDIDFQDFMILYEKCTAKTYYIFW